MSLQTPAQSDPEMILKLHQRIAALESKQTVRVGDWVLHQDAATGLPMLVAPGQDPMVLGTTDLPAEVQSALRGYALTSDVAQAVSGGSSNSLTVATTAQVAKVTATAAAQYTADSANALAGQALALLNAGASGYNFTDTFDRPAAADLGSDYTRSTVGSGGGVYGTDGAGFAASTSVAGALPEQWIDQHIVPTNTNIQIIDSALDTPPRPGSGSGTVNSQHALRGRVSADGLDYVEVSLEDSHVALGYSLGGVYTPVITAQPQAMGNGDNWSFRVGTALDATEYTLLRNGLATPATWRDLGGLYPIDALHRYGAMANKAGTVIEYFFITTQIEAPRVQQFIVSDSIA